MHGNMVLDFTFLFFQSSKFCQAQFQLASSVPVQLGTEISLNISVTPAPPHPPTRASIFEPLLDYLES